MLQQFNSHIKKKQHIIEEISDELLIQNRLAKAYFIMSSLIVVFSLGTVFMSLFYSGKITMFTCTISMHITLILIFFSGMIFLPYHPRHYGFNLDKMKMNLTFALFYGLIGLTIAVALRFTFADKGFPQFGFQTDRIAYNIIIHLTIYPIFVLVQEATTRGYFQSFFVAAFDGIKYKKLLAIAISSFIFAQFHLVLGFKIFIIAYFFSLLMGWFYEKSRSLLGVFIFHYLIGLGFFFLTK